MRKGYRLALIFLSIGALLNVMFVPIFDTWGGLFPSDVDRNFFDVIEMVFDDADCWGLWVVQLTMSIFIPSLIMLFMAICGNRGLFIASNGIGIFLWLIQVIEYGMEDDGFAHMFDIDDSSISIGVWIAVVIYAISFLVALSSKKQAQTTDSGYAFAVPRDEHPTSAGFSRKPVICKQTPTPSVGTFRSKFCSQCGATIDGKMKFCGSCGHKVE